MPEAIDFEAAESRYMEMPGGRRFYIAEPEFDLYEMAFTLAGNARFNGTGTRNQHDHQISVAEHSIRVSYMLAALAVALGLSKEEIKMWAMLGLMHDSPEHVLGDVPGPWKILLPDFCKLEQYLWEHIVGWISTDFDIEMPRQMPEFLKLHDWKGLFLEAREVMSSQGRDWVMASEDTLPGIADLPLHWWSPTDAENQFVRRFFEIVDYGREDG